MFRSIILSAAIVAGLVIRAEAADLIVTIKGAGADNGQILLSVFNSSESWMKQPLASRRVQVSGTGTARASFTLAAGTYGIALTHDANSNGKMDVNALGMPKEAFGFSNRARPRFGPPAFTKAAFELPAGGKRITISLDRADR